MDITINSPYTDKQVFLYEIISNADEFMVTFLLVFTMLQLTEP